MYPFAENVYHKLAFVAIFWAVSPHLLSRNGKIWRDGANIFFLKKMLILCCANYEIVLKKLIIRKWMIYNVIYY